MPLLDRAREREILQMLAKFYPNKGSGRHIAEHLSHPISNASPEFVAEATYLAEHGLVTFQAVRMQSDPTAPFKQVIDSLVITAKGMDFLQDDGGLSTILGVVTVRLHDDTIKALLIAKVSASDGDRGAKDQLIAAIKSLPAEATKSIAMRLMEQGLAAAPASLAALRTLAGL